MRTIIFLLLFFSLNLNAQEFAFAFVTDTHIGSSTSEEDLIRTIEDINKLANLDFALITGDITEMGTNTELKRAKEIIDRLEIPYYVVPGNHDTGWSESGGVGFIREFGSDKFVFEHEGYKFIGTASGPYVRMSDGHIPRDAIVWLDQILKETPKEQPIVFINHYPLDNSLDNWYEATDRLKKYNIQFAICGHGHRNKAKNFEGIPGTMGRSNLRANDTVGGYNIVEIKEDEAVFRERKPGVKTGRPWRKIPLQKHIFDTSENYERPSYAVNDSFPGVKKLWNYHSDANVISTPAYVNGSVIFGNSTGKIQALSEENGEPEWSYQTEGGIFSSPAAYKGNVILGSGDGNIYSLNARTGELEWKTAADASVLGSPVIEDGTVYIGASDGKFRALNAETGKVKWSYEGLEGPVVSSPLLYENKVIFGAWDNNLYALNKKDGTLLWKWNNGSPNRMFSPAMVIPVAHNDVVYIVAPDRYLSAIDAESGETLWRTRKAVVRESLGISDDKSEIFAKTMNDTVTAFKTSRTAPHIAWKMDAGYGYDHVPSMLFESNDQIFFGTRNGVVYSINSSTKEVIWKHKIDNSMVNTIKLLGKKKLVATTMDGKVALLTWK